MKFIPKAVTRHIGRVILQSQKHSPHILFAAGVVGVVGSTVLACRATLKIEDALDEVKSDLDLVKEKGGEFVANGNENYGDREYHQDLLVVWLRAGVRVAKLYGPAVIVGGLSIAALTGSHIQLTRRNAALTAAFGLITKAFEEYRERVRGFVGDDKEVELYRGVHMEEVDVDGKKQMVPIIDPEDAPTYAVCFDEGNPNYEKDAGFNRTFLHHMQNYMNDRLNSVGHVFLNEVYDALGFPHTSIGALVGWVRGSDDGDSFIDFGISEWANRDFIRGAERSCWLDFNVDGLIYDKI
jgi:hypothetical protein